MKAIFVLRSLIGVVIYPFMVLILVGPTVLTSYWGWRRWADACVSLWAHCSLLLFGVRVEVISPPPRREIGCIYLFNHTSFFDIFSLQYKIAWLRFGSKVELFRIPVFGFAMKAVGVLPIARKNREEVFRLYDSSVARIKNGESFALAPEGTRQREEVIGPFKSGPTTFAIHANCLLVPVVIQGALDVMPKGTWLPNSDRWMRTIRIEFLEPVSTVGCVDADRHKLNDLIRERMLESLSRLQQMAKLAKD